jgi:hypothetical protein
MAARKPKSTRGGGGGRQTGAGGKATESADLRLLARDAALAALKRLADLSRSEDERVALAATQELLNRAFGKTSAVGADDAPASQPLIIKIVKFGEAGVADSQGGGQS